MSDSTKSGRDHHSADNSTKQVDSLPDIPFPEPPAEGNWITDYAWVSGLAGALMVLGMAVLYKATGALEKGVSFAGWQLTQTRQDTILLALAIIAFTMLAVELARLYLRDRENFFVIHPHLKNGRYGAFLGDALKNWLLYLCLLGVVVFFFKTANEYGYTSNNEYYQIWFRLLELAFSAYLFGGLPYVLITRAVKHDPLSDRRDYSTLMLRSLLWLASFFPGLKRFRPGFSEIDKKVTRGLLVKLFFTPLMTVFFSDQFPHLVNNVGFIGFVIPAIFSGSGYTQAQFNMDLFNVGLSFIFSIDVALAWCGYTISSRWVNNQTVTAEPTMLGWLVCIACYPPFQRIFGVYYAAPPEREILQMGHPWVVTIFVVMMLLSYLVYMSATLWFGVRFSNLTNRGIIRKGPYAVVRHPAYASKNFSWWCIMFPAVIYNAVNTHLAMAAVQIIGLVFMTWLYYLRSITEERHLSVDPYYVEYCKQVKYRFIPGVI